MERMKSNINRIIDLIKGKKNIPPFFEKYVSIFYEQCFGKDFVDYNDEQMFQLTLESFKFFQNKPKNTFKLRLYNPTKKTYGFESEYTILDIINNDMPFLVDSVVMQFDNRGINIKNIIHPVLDSKRSADGKIESFSAGGKKPNESVIQLHLSKINDKELSELEECISEILKTVRLVVDDWRKMVSVAKESADNFKNIDFKKEDFDSKEVKNFIDWAVDNNFIFFGSIEFDIENKNGHYAFKEVPKSRFGVYKSEYKDTKPTIVNVSSGEISDTIKHPYLIEILKSRYKSYIHRYSNAERIRIQKFDKNGKVIGEYRFIGLFTSSVYYQNSRLIPIIRKKIERVIEDSDFSPSSSNFKDLTSTLESYPRDELFQIDHQDLLRISMGIVSISGRSIVRIFARNDKFSRFVSCLIFVPRDRFSTNLRYKIQILLSKTYNGEVSDAFVQIADSNLTRLHIIIRTDHDVDKVDVDELEQELIKLCRLWSDDFRDEVIEKYENEEAKNILDIYSNAFSVSYTNRFNAQEAVLDVSHIDQCLKSNKIVCDLYKSAAVAKDVVELKIYSPEKELLLSDIMPILDRFGFNVVHEHTYLVSLKNKRSIWIHYFHINLSKSGDVLTNTIKKNFIEIVSKIISGETKVGYLNRLVISANLSWRQVELIRAYDTYLYQIGFRFNQRYVSDVLVKHNNLTKLLVELFELKFDPSIKGGRKEAVNKISAKIKSGLNKISDIGEDSVIRRMFNVIDSTLRTNFYQVGENNKNKRYISFKLNSQQIIDIPLPVMYVEIFVYSPQFEAIHLRGGKVARGGLRWSDRQDDFRTEILGLVKAQMTKNAVIVPVGSKGGFVIKRDTTGLSRDEILSIAIECYKNFLRGLLDITDNIVDGKVVHPKNVIRYDEDDSYLVVAADKGTATFSDIANKISAEYNFWLGDAFASGGSVGYDHKKMGITARGAWVSVVRHFSDIGIDISKQDFTCVGIGDLSGDVFGNGMLLSDHIKLVAAFNHMHIFIDPNPDPIASIKERRRMFNLPRSSWSDYDKSKISAGGGIFERSAKSIKLSEKIKEALSIEQDNITPDELISAILKAPVDLLWNGGIGTYVKASDENHIDAGDRINDDLRINGCDLRCKVVGEGGNLGFTQKGRIEAALNDVMIYTDAMDNSAGVDCSDHEVNIKIALTSAMKAKKVSLKERNKILEEMTEEVAKLVLNDNKMQTAAVSSASTQGYLALGGQLQFLNSLEKSGLLNREVEFLPSNKEIAKRQSDKIAMTRPELCVMLAYSKMDLYPQILASDLVKEEYFVKPDLFGYFPKLLQKKFPDEIENHQLRSEIIATQITNSIVNKAGIAFVHQIVSDTGFSAVDVVRNFVIVCDAFSLDEIWEEIENIGNKITAEARSRMFFTINKLLERGVIWLLRNQQKIDISIAVVKYGSIIKQLYEILHDILVAASKDSFNKKVSNYSQVKIPTELSKKIASMDPLASAFDIAEIASKSDFNIKVIARIYFEVGTRFDLKWLRAKVSATSVDNYWQKLSYKTILEDLYNYQMRIAKQVVNFSCSNKDACPAYSSLDYWIENNSFMVRRYDDFIAELKEQPSPDLSMFVVALNRIRVLT
jgi:glutamate dehydrogenase